MPCLINDTCSADFVRQRAKLEKDFPKIVADLASLYEKIRKDYKSVPQSHGVPGYKNLVWKYRCESSDMNRGKSGSFRVLGYYREKDETMYVFSVYSKKQFEQPPTNDLVKWIKNIQAAFSQDSAVGKPLAAPVPTVEVWVICGTSLSDDEKGAFGDRCAAHRTISSN